MKRNENKFDNDFDIGALALNGKRFHEADEIFNELVKKDKSSAAWYGLALSKAGLFLNDDFATIEEFFLFSESKIT